MRALTLCLVALSVACSYADYAVVEPDQHRLLTPSRPYERERVFPATPDPLAVTPGSLLQLLRKDGTCTRKLPMRDVRTNAQGIWFVRDTGGAAALGSRQSLSSAARATVQALSAQDRARLITRAPKGCALTGILEDGAQVDELRCDKARLTQWLAAALEREAASPEVAGPAAGSTKPPPRRHIKELTGSWRFELPDGVSTGPRFTFAQRPDAWTKGIAMPDGLRWEDVEEIYVWGTNGAKMAVGFLPNYAAQLAGIKMPDMSVGPVCAKGSSLWTMRGKGMETPDPARAPTALFESSMIRRSQARLRLSVEGGLDAQDASSWTGSVGLGGRFLEVMEIEGSYRQLQVPWESTPTRLTQLTLQGGLHMDLDYERTLAIFLGAGVGWGWDAQEENHETQRIRAGLRWRPWGPLYLEAYPFNPTRMHRRAIDTAAERTRWFWMSSVGIGLEL